MGIPRTSRSGPPVAALCLGINGYEPLAKLHNCERDADAIASEVRGLPDGLNGTCAATVRKGNRLNNKNAMISAVREFARGINREAPPRMVMVSFSGHGFQIGDKILLAPRSAAKDEDKLKEEALSHDEIFQILYEEIHSKMQTNDVFYLVILDVCRETLGGVPSAVGFSPTLDPIYREGRQSMRWALCAGTNRGSVASDEETFSSHLISHECGFFEPNVPVRTAMELVREKVLARHPDQSPLMTMDHIPHEFCLQEQPQDCVRYDVCLCYNKDTDLRSANFIAEKLKGAGVTTFAGARPGDNVEIEQAKAICNSTVVVVIISAKTFQEIQSFAQICGSAHPQTRGQNELAHLLCQMDMVLEVFEHRFSKMKVLPVYFGDEIQEQETGKFCFSVVDRPNCWPILSAEHAKKLSPLVSDSPDPTDPPYCFQSA